MLAVKVIIADKQPMFAEGLSIILSAVENIQVVATVTSSSEILEILNTIYCQVVILDLPVPLENDIDIIDQIKKQHPGTHVLIFTSKYEPEAINRAMLAGASGFVMKNTRKDEMIYALLKVARGEIFLGTLVSQAMAEYYLTLRHALAAKPQSL